MASTLKPAPVSTPLAKIPVVKGPVRQPLLFRKPLPMSTGLGNAILMNVCVSSCKTVKIEGSDEGIITLVDRSVPFQLDEYAWLFWPEIGVRRGSP